MASTSKFPRYYRPRPYQVELHKMWREKRIGVAVYPRQSGKDVSKYLIERAEQYQPVIEMPTGVDVEIVFLEGVYVRN